MRELLSKSYKKKYRKSTGGGVIVIGTTFFGKRFFAPRFFGIRYFG
jgi:hypothetical protein